MAQFRGLFGTQKGMSAKGHSGSGRSEKEPAFVSRRNFLQGMASASLGTRALLSFPGRISGAAPFMGGASASQQTLKSIKIARFESFKVVVPMKPGSVLSDDAADLEPFWHDFQKGNPEAPKFIIKLFSEDGLVGIGETQRGVEGAAVSKNGNFLVGQNILELNFADSSLGLPEESTSDGFEIAIYDLIGKTFGVPIHVLLGGRFQDRVAVTYWTAQRNEADLVAIAKQASELGFSHLKFKARLGTPVDQLVRAVAKAVPNLNLGVDYNQSFSDPGSFLPVAKRLEGLPLSIEDPLPGRLEWWCELRQRLAINFALTPNWRINRGEIEETYYSENRIRSGPDGSGVQMFEAAKLGACDSFNLSDSHFRGFVRNAYVAEVAGIPVWHGSGAELGIRDTAYIHAAAATRSCTIPSDTICFLREDDLLTRPFMKTISNGYAEVPRGPGLGVELNEDAVRRYQVK
jgi:L-alanine-DL-glutamate epimerase-like enolase superfamily enzyme